MPTHNPPKARMSVTVSKRTARMVEELRKTTDADSASEVIRNSIRLGFAVMTAEQAGAKLMLVKEGEQTPISVLQDFPANDGVRDEH